jgi:hypothetical protein
MCRGTLFHDWSDWSLHAENDVLRENENNKHNPTVIGRLFLQKRKCKRCKLLDFRSTKVIVF